MFARNYKKQNIFKRTLLKLLKLYAFDKETLNIVNPNYKNQSKNYYKFNKKTYILSKGYLDLERKINKLDIYFRFAPSNQLWNSTNRWKRIIPNINKETLIKVCLLSLKNSIHKFLEKNFLEIKIHLIADNSNEKFNNEILSLLKSENFKSILHNSKISGNRGSYVECCDQAEKAEDLIFFIEDDYLFEINSIDELIFTYSRLSTLFKKDIFICPSDYPFYYDSAYNTSLFVGKNYRWRYVKETLLTFLFSKKLLNQHKKEIRLVGEKINEPFEKPLHKVYNDTPCLAPVSSLSYHISRSVPAINEDWLKVWDHNYQKLIKIK